jgi:hypothetical protein
MNLRFQQRLDGHLLRSERQRTLIVLSIFLFIVSYQLVNRYFLRVDEETNSLKRLRNHKSKQK